jgi:predicted dehydrogenase
MAEPVRWGILGTGAIAAAFALDLAGAGSGRVVAVGSRSAGSAGRFADAFGIAGRHASYQALVDDPDVEVVYVATPHPMHHAHARLALEHGKAVLVEKPFTMDAPEAADLVATARARGLFLMEAMWTRFLPHIVEVRRLLAEGALGDVVTVIADHGQWFAEDRSSRLFAPELGGGALLDLGVYPVSFASMVLGTPDRVRAIADAAFTGVDAQTSVLLGHPGGAQAVLTCTLAAVGPTRAAVVGTEGRLEIDHPFYAPAGLTVVPRTGAPVRIDPAHEGLGLRYEADEVARCLRAGQVESPWMPLDESVSVMATMDEIRSQSAI